MLLGLVRLAGSSCLVRGWLLTDRTHRLGLVSKSLCQHADLVGGLGGRRLRLGRRSLSGGCLVLSRLKSASSFSAASPSSTAVPPSGVLLLPSGVGLAFLILAVARDVSDDEAVAAHWGLGARILVIGARGEVIETCTHRLSLIRATLST